MRNVTTSCALALMVISESSALAQPCTLSPDDWILTDDGLASYDTSMAINQDTLVVGRRYLNGGETHVYKRSGNTWEFAQSLSAPGLTPQASFGESVALDHDTIVVGAFSMNTVGFGNGAVFIYQRISCNEWKFQQMLVEPGVTCNNAAFGESVAVNGDTIVVTSAGNLCSGGTQHASIFKRTGETWMFQQVVTPPPNLPPGKFGDSCALGCDILILGSPSYSSGGNGMAFTYRLINNAWVYQQTLIPSTPDFGDKFGAAAALSGDRLAIGAPGWNSGNGKVFIFSRSGNTFIEQASVVQPGPVDPWFEFFGKALAFAGETLVVAAPEETYQGNGYSGNVYIFQHTTGSSWPLLMELPNPDPGYMHLFGYAVAVGPGVIAIRERLPENGFDEVTYLEQCPALGGVNGCNPDSDGDAIPDDWEISGVPYTNSQGQPARYLLDLDGDGVSDADPYHKDVFVEIDALSGFAPQVAGIQRVMDAYGAVPLSLVNNPDCQPGIALHVLIDEMNLPFSEWTLDDVTGDGVKDWPTEFDQLKITASSGTPVNGYFCTVAERSSTDGAMIREAKRKVFRYCIFCSKIDDVKRISGIAETPGNDLIVGMGWWSPVGGNANQQAGTFMHELGHTLGLQHGGGDTINYKPNYHSVMNYMWNYAAPWRRPGSWPLDPGGLGYSQDELIAITEDNLLDCEHLIQSNFPIFYNYSGVQVPHNIAPPGEPVALRLSRIDLPFDFGGVEDECDFRPLDVDVNRLKRDDPPSPAQTLFGHSDWDHLFYKFTDNAWFNEGVHQAIEANAEDEPTFELYQQIATMLPPFCAGDIINDRIVNVADLLAVIIAWGPCSNGCLADIAPGTPDGQVDVADLLAVINGWGPCPQ